MSRYQCWNCLTDYNGDYERCDNCTSKGYDKPTMWRLGPNYVLPTNADRIRAMSDGELAGYLAGISGGTAIKMAEQFGFTLDQEKKQKYIDKLKAEYLKRLQQAAEEDN